MDKVAARPGSGKYPRGTASAAAAGHRPRERRPGRNLPSERGIRPRARLAFPFLAALIASCGSIELVPIQMSRVGQLEVYDQTFTFDIDNECRATEDTSISTQRWERQRCINQRIDEDLGHLVGDRNWQSLKDLYGFGNMRQELLAGKLLIRGYLSALIYLDPRDSDHFFFDAVGRFFILREDTGEILLNGDFHTLPQSHAIADLRAGYINVDIQQIITRIPGQHTYLQESTVRYRIYIDLRQQAKQVYTIDYNRPHEVYLVRNPDRPRTFELRPIGALYFRDRADSAKLLDLRGRGFLRQDYGEPSEGMEQ